MSSKPARLYRSTAKSLTRSRRNSLIAMLVPPRLEAVLCAGEATRDSLCCGLPVGECDRFEPLIFHPRGLSAHACMSERLRVCDCLVMSQCEGGKRERLINFCSCWVIGSNVACMRARLPFQVAPARPDSLRLTVDPTQAGRAFMPRSNWGILEQTHCSRMFASIARKAGWLILHLSVTSGLHFHLNCKISAIPL